MKNYISCHVLFSFWKSSCTGSFSFVTISKYFFKNLFLLKPKQNATDGSRQFSCCEKQMTPYWRSQVDTHKLTHSNYYVPHLCLCYYTCKMVFLFMSEYIISIFSSILHFFWICVRIYLPSPFKSYTRKVLKGRKSKLLMFVWCSLSAFQFRFIHLSVCNCQFAAVTCLLYIKNVAPRCIQLHPRS